jgi:hypothetical protein
VEMGYQYKNILMASLILAQDKRWRRA